MCLFLAFYPLFTSGRNVLVYHSFHPTLEWLLENKEAVEKYKNEAGEFICNKYNWDDVVEKTMRAYQ